MSNQSKTILNKPSNGSGSNDLPGEGIYHYRLEEDDGKSRIHLRIDPDEVSPCVVPVNDVGKLVDCLLAYGAGNDIYLRLNPGQEVGQS